jgi:RNA polymerase sigma factor (sigma-70 family)
MTSAAFHRVFLQIFWTRRPIPGSIRVKTVPKRGFTVKAGQPGHLIRHIHAVMNAACLEATTDAELLDRCLVHRDDRAFEMLLRRYGPLVWSLCRRVLGDSPDAEDAFQATFLVLVRKGRSLHRPNLLGNWLYGVAWRTARKARAASARRRACERPLGNMAASPTERDPWRELLPLLDEEVRRLPERYRQPLVLCYFLGKTYAEAACALGLPEGTVASRLARARECLRHRLSRGDSALPGGLIVEALSQATAPVAPPAALVSATIESARSLASGTMIGGAISANFISLSWIYVRRSRGSSP